MLLQGFREVVGAVLVQSIEIVRRFLRMQGRLQAVQAGIGYGAGRKTGVGIGVVGAVNL